MNSLFIYELQSTLRSMGIDDPALLRRVLMEKLASCPADCNRKDIDKIFGFQCGEYSKHNVYVALSNKKILSLMISKMGIGIETDQINYKEAFSSYFGRDEFRDAPVPGLKNMEGFLSYLIKNDNAELVDYLFELVHPDVCPLLIYQTFRYSKEKSNSSVFEVAKKYAEQYEKPYSEILTLLVTPQEKTDYASLFSLLDKLSLVTQYDFFCYVERRIIEVNPEYYGELMHYILNRYQDYFSDPDASRKIFFAIEDPPYKRNVDKLQFIENHYDIFEVKLGKLNPASHSSSELRQHRTMQRRNPVPYFVKKYLDWAIYCKDENLLNRMLLSLSKNPYIESVPLICEHMLLENKLGYTGTYPEDVLAVLDKWSHSVSSERSNTQFVERKDLRESTDLNVALRYVETAFQTKWQTKWHRYDEVREEIDSIIVFCQNIRGEKDYEKKISVLLDFIYSHVIQMEPKTKRPKWSHSFSDIFTKIFEEFLSTGDLAELYQELSSKQEIGFYLHTNYSWLGYRNALQKRLEEGKYVTDQMAISLLKLLFVDEGVDTKNILEKIKSPSNLPKSLCDRDYREFQLALFNCWHGETLNPKNVALAQFELLSKLIKSATYIDLCTFYITVAEMRAKDETLAIKAAILILQRNDGKKYELEMLVEKLGVNFVGESLLSEHCKNNKDQVLFECIIRAGIKEKEFDLLHQMLFYIFQKEIMSEDDLSRVFYKFTITQNGRDMDLEQIHFLQSVSARFSVAESARKLNSRLEKMRVQKEDSLC